VLPSGGRLRNILSCINRVYPSESRADNIACRNVHPIDLRTQIQTAGELRWTGQVAYRRKKKLPAITITPASPGTASRLIAPLAGAVDAEAEDPAAPADPDTAPPLLDAALAPALDAKLVEVVKVPLAVEMDLASVLAAVVLTVPVRSPDAARPPPVPVRVGAAYPAVYISVVELRYEYGSHLDRSRWREG
jgi:hypothetical protein